MAFRELVLQNRSYRNYDSACSLRREDLLELVDLARFTPTAKNKQELKFCIACKKEEISEILAISLWAQSLKDRKLPYPGKEPAGFIVICRDKDIQPSLDLSLIDSGIAAQTILLGATEKGLGGCINLSFQKQKLSALLSLPENVEPVILLAIGKPGDKIVLTDVAADGDTTYWRDENDAHYVPKRALEDIILPKR